MPSLTDEEVHDRVCEARVRTGWGPRLIASETGIPHATVSRCLARRGLSRRPAAPKGTVRRFEWPCPGDLLQMDTKRFARVTRPGHAVTGDRYRSGAERRQGVGYEIAHSMIDDHSRLAYTELHRDERAATVTGFVGRALADLLAREGISHRTIPARTPKRNDKVERYQQTLKREWGLGQRYRSSRRGAATLAPPLQPHPTPQLDRRLRSDHRVRDVLRQEN